MLIGLFTTFCVIKLLWAGVDALTANLPATDKKLLNSVMGTLAFQGVAVVWIIYFLRQQQLSWSEAFGFRVATAGRAILTGLVAAVLILPIAWMLQHFSVEVLSRFKLETNPQDIVKSFQETQKVGGVLLRERIVFGFSVILFAPIAEELLFRGIIYPTFKQLGHRHIALWATSLLFAVLHANLPSMLPFILLAVTLAAVYEYTDNLLGPIVAHSFFNAANFIYLIYEQPINKFLAHG
jgi:membrane protease YdiL (CAAX protease family)